MMTAKLSRRSLAIACAAMLFGGAAQAADTMTKEQYKAEKERIDATYNTAKDRCGQMSGNAKDICMAEAKGAQKVGVAELDARNNNTDRARQNARYAKAEADYEVAKERCDDSAGNKRDVCLKEAKAAETRAKADARVERADKQATTDSNQRAAATRRDAAEDKRDAAYNVAKERCDALAGDAKARCLEDARAKYRPQ